MFKSVKKKNAKIDLNHTSKVLIINLGQIEDALVTTPLISLLKEKTNCEITLLVDKKNQIAFANNRNVSNRIILDTRFFEILKTIKQLNINKYDVIIDSHINVSPIINLIIGLTKSEYKLALKKSNERLFTKTFDRIKDIHIIDEMLLFANAFTIAYSKGDINIEYQPTLESRQAIINFKIKSKLDTTKPLIGINISAKSHSKYWGTDRFVRLNKYLENYDINVIILHNPDDKERAEKIVRDNGTIFCNTNFDEFVSMIYELDFLFTPATSVVQLASSKEIPMFILYQYKEIAKKWCPYKSSYDCVITEEPNFSKLSYGKTLNSFIPFFDNFYKQSFGSETENERREM